MTMNENMKSFIRYLVAAAEKSCISCVCCITCRLIRCKSCCLFSLSRIGELENFPVALKDENYGKGLTSQADYPEIRANSRQKKNS